MQQLHEYYANCNIANTEIMINLEIWNAEKPNL